MKLHTAKKFYKTGFGLIDFAVWITIFSVMIIGFLAVSSARNKHKNFVADNLQKQTILDKINSYVLKEISQPSKLDINGILIHKSCDENGQSFNVICPTGSAVDIITSSKDINNIYKNNLGFVPYQTLGLNKEDVIDSNNKFYLFLAYQPVSNKPYQYYVFSQPEKSLKNSDIEKVRNITETENNNQNNVMPAIQLSNCHITSAISKQYQQDQTITTNEDKYLDILSGAKKEVTCSSYNNSQNIKYANNINRNLPSDAIINFQCFSGDTDYTPNEKCERVCTTFLHNGITYNVEPKFFGDKVLINPTALDNSYPQKLYSNLYDALNISKALGSILKLKCEADYNYAIDSLTNISPCKDPDYILSGDAKSCQYTCAISSSSIGVGSNTNRYANGTSYETIINDTVCIQGITVKDKTLLNPLITCTEKTPIITLNSGNDIYKICQCNSADYFVNNGKNECVKGCKISLDVVGPGDLIDSNKLYYEGQLVSEIFSDVTCVANATKISLTTEQLLKHRDNKKYCILAVKTELSGKSIIISQGFNKKLCSCNSGYSMLAENSIANAVYDAQYQSKGSFINFPGIDPLYNYSQRNFAAKYDCFLMCSATTLDTLKQNVAADPSGRLSNLVIGYHKNGLTPRQIAIVDSLNTINFKIYNNSSGQTIIIRDLFYDGTLKKKLEPLNCPAPTLSDIYTDYCLNINLQGKRLFFTSCKDSFGEVSFNSLPLLQIKSGGSL